MTPPATTVESERSLALRLGGRECRVRLGRGVVARLPALVGEQAAAVLIDNAVPHLHRLRLVPALRDAARRPLPTRTLVGGEQVKRIEELDHVYRWLAQVRLPRDGILVGVGGGALLDLAGFAAATWQRGVRYVALPTTLLAMADAAVGGKTAIDAGGLKNSVGAFHPAQTVLADPDFLATMPRRQWRGGLAEMIKAAVIGAPALFAALERRAGVLALHFADGDPDAAPAAAALALPWSAWIDRALRVKIRIVRSDFRETGPRRALNLGHTLGHALEAAGGYTHGEAVSVGMAAVARLAARRGLCARDDARRIQALLVACGLPVAAKPPPRHELERLIAGDKKRLGGEVRWVLPARIGAVVLDQSVSIEEAAAAARATRG